MKRSNFGGIRVTRKLATPTKQTKKRRMSSRSPSIPESRLLEADEHVASVGGQQRSCIIVVFFPRNKVMRALGGVIE